MKPLLSIQDLTLDYCLPDGSRVNVLRKASVNVGRNEAVGILGPSGSGKTSLLRCILGIPSGEAQIRCATLDFEDMNLLTMSDRERHALRRNRLGVIFQDPGNRLSPFSTIRRQIEDASAGRWNRIRSLQALSAVGLSNANRIASSYPHELSGGECQRVAIAQALASSPSLLLADEPTSALDTIAQRHIIDLLKRIRAGSDISMVVISHDPSMLRALVDRILELREGSLIDYAPPTAKLDRPRRQVSVVPMADVPPFLEVHELKLIHGAARGWRRWHRKKVSHPALQGTSIRIQSGECVAVVGQSGSGKSTLARCIAGINKPQSGAIYLSAEPLSHDRPPALRRALQLILQDTAGALNPRLTVAQILEEPFRIERQRASNRHSPEPGRQEVSGRIEKILEEVSLPVGYLGRRSPQLSGGERQRVSIARALVLRPTLLLLDEALAGLDAELQQSILDLLERLRTRHGLTCIHFSHDLRRMLIAADRIAVMHEGCIVESHTAAEFSKLARHPASLRLLQAVLPDPEEL